MFAVEVSEKGRFQVTSLSPNRRIYNLVIRAVHGYSGRIADRIKARAAFTAVQAVGLMVHYTQTTLLPSIVGINGTGLIPGGISGKGDRKHLYVSTERPAKDGALPNKLTRRGTDVTIHLDPVLMKGQL